MVILIHIRVLSTVVIAFLVASFACSVALAAEPKRVMLLHSFGPDFKPWSEHAKTVRAEFDRQSPWPLDIIEKSLVTARSANENPEGPFVDYLRALFANSPLDLIVSIGAPAANFLQRHRQQLFATTPMVFTAVERRRIQPSSLTENDTVVALVQNFPAIIENILHVLPDTKTVAVVIGNSPLESLWLEVLRKEFAPFADRVSFIWYNDRSFADILKNADALPLHSAIYWHQMNVDVAGVVHQGGKALPALYAVANAPIFTFTDAFFGGEVVGGPMNSVAEGSRLTVAVAIRILGGEKAGDIKIPPIGFATPKFDWRLMQRWGISEKNLPPDSEVHFREASAWEKYWLHILGVLAALLMQGALITWLLIEHSRRQKAEADAMHRADELARVNRFATAGQLSAAIAHEIRQPLAAIASTGSAGLNWLRKQVPDLQEAQAAFDTIIKQVHRADDVMKSVRAMFDHRITVQSTVNINELVQQVLALTYRAVGANGIVLETRLTDDPPPLVKADPVQLQQVVLNLVMNAVEAMASSDQRERMVLRLETGVAQDGTVWLTVLDTGPGFDAKVAKDPFAPFVSTKAKGMGMGLSICKSIVEHHGGQLTANSNMPSGATLRIVLPRESAI
jgi:signal transduction histidine kinase